MPDKPRRIDLTPEDIKTLLERVKPVVSEQDYEAIKAMADTIESLSQVRDQKAASIKRLLNLLFGQKSEKKNKVLDEPKDNDGDDPKGGKKPRKKERDMVETAHQLIRAQKKCLSVTKASNMAIPVRNALMERSIGVKSPRPRFELWVPPLYNKGVKFLIALPL